MKQGQISMFILIGLVIVITVALGIFVITALQSDSPGGKAGVDIPTELEPLQSAILTCQQRLLEEGARELLFNGGYINPEQAGIVAGAFGTGNAVELSGRSVAYWTHYERGQLQSEKPALVGTHEHSIYNQLKAHIQEGLINCFDINDYPQYTITRATPHTSIQFQNKRTQVTTYWPMTINGGSFGTAEFNAFQTTSDIPIEHLYNTAEDITNAYSATRSVEWLTMNWLSVYGGLGNLPPVYQGVRMTDEFTIYNLQEAQEEFKAVLTYMTQSMTVIGSKNAKLFTSEEPVLQQLYAGGRMSVTTDVSDTEITIGQTQDPYIYLAINEQVGAAVPEILQSPSGIIGAFMPRVVDYDFVYDLRYPLIISLQEDGYLLNIGHEVLIDNNEPSIEREGDDPTAGYCATPGGAQAVIRADRTDLDAQLLFRCGAQTCDIGALENGRADVILPACGKGIIEANIQEYYSTPVEVFSSEGETITAQLRFHTPKTVRVRLQQKNVIVQGQGENKEYVLAANSGTASMDPTIVFTRQGSPYVGYVENDEVTLVPGTYDVMIVGVKEFDPPHEIPAETRDLDNWASSLVNPLPFAPLDGILDGIFGAIGIGEQTVTFPAINLTSAPLVYAQYLEENAIEITNVPDEIVLTVAGLPDPTIDTRVFAHLEDLEKMGSLIELGEDLPVSQNVVQVRS